MPAWQLWLDGLILHQRLRLLAHIFAGQPGFKEHVGQAGYETFAQEICANGKGSTDHQREAHLGYDNNKRLFGGCVHLKLKCKPAL